MRINIYPAPERCFSILPRLLRRGEVYLNTSPAPDKYFYIYLPDTSPAPEKPWKYLKTPLRRRRSIYTHFSGAGEVLIYTYLAPEKPGKPEKPEKYLYTLISTFPIFSSSSCLLARVLFVSRYFCIHAHYAIIAFQNVWQCAVVHISNYIFFLSNLCFQSREALILPLGHILVCTWSQFLQC